MDLIGNTGFVMVVEPLNRKQGLGLHPRELKHAAIILTKPLVASL
jgi:hypothetical protein